MNFETNIQKWVSIDNQIKQLNDKVKQLKEEKNTLTENINNYVVSNNISNSTIQISDGQLRFVKTKETQPLTFKYLEKCLHEIIKNEEQVTKILEYIKNKREVSYNSEIKRLYNN
jgi:septal ring factor EnvC (AmiA/AmiB activator)